jgi:hypothetical protein
MKKILFPSAALGDPPEVREENFNKSKPFPRLFNLTKVL